MKELEADLKLNRGRLHGAKQHINKSVQNDDYVNEYQYVADLINEQKQLQRETSNVKKSQRNNRKSDISKLQILYYDNNSSRNLLSSSDAAKIIHRYDLSQRLSSRETSSYECLTLSIRPNVPVCLYPDKMDIHVSAHIRREGIWEPHIVKVNVKILFVFFSHPFGHLS